MRIAILISAAVSLSFLSPSAAFATGATMVRHPISSSIPCQGRLSEVRVEEGNMYNGYNALTLACVDRPDHAQWIIRAEAGCDVDNSDDNAKLEDACGKDISKPVGLFFEAPQKQPTLHLYSLGRYVFASDCQAMRFASKHMEAVTNKVLSATDGQGWVCRQINKVDGLSTYNVDTGKDEGAKNFRFAHITTRGPEEAMDNDELKEDLDFSTILGVSDSDTHYQVHAVRGVASAN